MPENNQRPRNILEVINENVYNVGEGLRVVLGEIASIKQDITSFKAMFNAPEKPNAAPGNEGAK